MEMPYIKITRLTSEEIKAEIARLKSEKTQAMRQIDEIHAARIDNANRKVSEKFDQKAASVATKLRKIRMRAGGKKIEIENKSLEKNITEQFE